ncbi:MAG: MFS transporter [Clostridiales bacterium]|nr:MFS transporter [Clostridia bacterium]MCR4883717.1 MFS transporter [Clostridiales bacterium]
MSKVKRSIWNLPLLNSRTDRQTVRLPEMIFGYFLGPLLVLAMTCVTATYYLTFYRTYDDIVAQGNFLVLLPLISIIPMALANILVGIILGKTRTRQGKARPFILVAAPLLLVSGIVMFVIPYFSIGFRMAWMAITYNLFAALANPIYSNSHYLMVSLSTRNLDQRGKLSVVANIPAVAGNGLVSSILMPAVLSWIKAGEALGEGYLVVQNRWQLVMTLFAVAAFIGCCLEYLFTRERITEEDIQDDSSEPTAEAIPTGRQLKAAAGDKYWWIIMIFYFLYQAGVMFKGGYVFNIFCNDFFPSVNVFGQTMNAEGVQSLIALVGGIPLAAGMLFAWPVANKLGKRNFVLLGCVVSIAGSIVCLLAPSSFVVVTIGQVLKGFSSIPGAYIMMALFADVLDHLEAKNGFRVDGISMSVYSTILTVVNGLAVAFFNLFYDGGMFSHQQVSSFFFLGFEIFAHGILIVVLLFLNVEKNIKEEQRQIAERKKIESV